MSKRIISFFLLICLVFTGISGCKNKKTHTETPAPTRTPTQTLVPTPTILRNTIEKNPEDIMLFSFEDGNGDETMYQGALQSLDLTDAPWNQSFVLPLSVYNHTDTGKGFKMPLNNEKNANFQVLRASTTESYKANVEKCSYLRVWVDNVGEGTLSLSVLLSAGMYYFSYLNVEDAVITTSDGTELDVPRAFTTDEYIPEAIEAEPDSVVLPAGFSGWIAFPLSAKTVKYWSASPVAKLSKATTIDLRLSLETGKTEYYVIDDICLTNKTKGTVCSK